MGDLVYEWGHFRERRTKAWQVYDILGSTKQTRRSGSPSLETRVQPLRRQRASSHALSFPLRYGALVQRRVLLIMPKGGDNSPEKAVWCGVIL